MTGVVLGGFGGVGGACHRSYRRFTFDFSSLHDIRTLCNALLFFAMHWLFFIAWNTDALLRFATLCYALLRIDFSTLLQRVSEKVWSQENSKGTTPHFGSTYCAQSHWQTVAQGHDAAESTYVKDQSRTSKHEVFCDVKDELYIIPCNDSCSFSLALAGHAQTWVSTSNARQLQCSLAGQNDDFP